MKLARLSDYTSRERVAIATLEVVHYGRAMTTREIAARVGLSWKEADAMMNDISRVVPIFKDEADYCWKRSCD